MEAILGSLATIATLAVILLVGIRREVGGLTFWRIGRLGGSIYWARH